MFKIRASKGAVITVFNVSSCVVCHVCRAVWLCLSDHDDDGIAAGEGRSGYGYVVPWCDLVRALWLQHGD